MGTAPLVKTKVAQFALEYCGLNDAGVLGCLKHFPDMAIQM
jgi:beta-glucosidase-like glycosyl hydrolase